MALPMTGPTRDFAPVTHDTNRIAEVITELNALGATVSGLGSASYYLETFNGTGVATVQTLASVTTAVLDVAGTVVSNAGGGFSAASDIYTLPISGTYMLMGSARVTDSFGTSCNVGLGIHWQNDLLSPYFRWHKYVTGGGTRWSFDYSRIGQFSAGDQLRFYMFQDSGVNMAITAITWQVFRIAPVI